MLDILQHRIPRAQFLFSPFDLVNRPEAAAVAVRAMHHQKRLQHSDINTAKVMQMRRDPALLRHVRESDLICIDGIGVVWGCRLLNIRTKGRVPGIDLMMDVLAECEEQNFRPYFLGATPQVIDDMVERLRVLFPSLKMAGWRNGYFSPECEKQIVDDIRNTGADCLFVGITSPIKERFLHDHRDALNVPLQVGVGGAFDVISGQLRRAPVFMQRLGLEWFFRMMQEPRRLFGRYLIVNTTFTGMLTRHIAVNMLRRIHARKKKR